MKTTVGNLRINIASFIGLFLVINLLSPVSGWAATKPLSRTPVSVQQVKLVAQQQPAARPIFTEVHSERDYLTRNRTNVRILGVIRDVDILNKNYSVKIYGMRGTGKTFLGTASIEEGAGNDTYLHFDFTSRAMLLQNNSYTNFRAELREKRGGREVGPVLAHTEVQIPIQPPAPVFQMLTEMLNPNTPQVIAPIARNEEYWFGRRRVLRFSYLVRRNDDPSKISILIKAHLGSGEDNSVGLGEYIFNRDGTNDGGSASFGTSVVLRHIINGALTGPHEVNVRLGGVRLRRDGRRIVVMPGFQTILHD